VRELQTWVDRNVRFDAKAPDPMLFPDTEAAITTAQEFEEKIIPITHDHHVPREAREGRTWTRNSWKRADKQQCEHWATGIVVIGQGRGDSFKICVAKDKCKTHWGKEIAAKTRVEKQSAKGGGSKKEDATPKRPAWEIEEERRKKKAAAWLKIAPAILDAFAIAIGKASTDATGDLARLIMDRIHVHPGHAKMVDNLMPLRSTAGDFVRHVGLQILAGVILDQWNAADRVPKLGKTFGVDVAAIIKAATPKEEKPAKDKKAPTIAESNAKKIKEAEAHKKRSAKKRKAS